MRTPLATPLLRYWNYAPLILLFFLSSSPMPYTPVILPFFLSSSPKSYIRFHLNPLLVIEVSIWSPVPSLRCYICVYINSLTTKYCIFKQFVETKYSKERPGSIVTETLKNGILIPLVISKELHFNAEFKYLSFIKISNTLQKLRAWEEFPHFWK